MAWRWRKGKSVRPPENGFLRGCWLMVNRYLGHNVPIQAAALAFYLLFMIFPLTIFFSALLGQLHLDVTGLTHAAGEFLPSEVVELLGMYLQYVTDNPSLKLLLFGLFFSIYFPMRATNTLMRAVRTAYRLGPPKAPIRHTLKSLLYTVMLIVTIVLTLVLVSVGEAALDYAIDHFGLPVYMASLWQRLRFPVMGLVMYFALYFLYALPQDTHLRARDLYPGVLAALLGWMVTAYLFSWYVENIASYSLFYGSIGAVIVLLIWLNFTAAILILGAELNGTLIALRKDKALRRQERAGESAPAAPPSGETP